MIKHDQLIESSNESEVFGDCYRTAIACVMSMNPADVPHFYNGDNSTLDLDDCWTNITNWLNDRGHNIISVRYDGDIELEEVLGHGDRVANGMYWFLSGCTKHKNDLVNHVVICRNDKIIHDTSKKSRANGGITGPCNSGFWEIEIIVRLIS